MDKECREKVANRILIDCLDKIDDIVKAGDQDTGTQFQERCTQVALKYYWDNKKINNINKGE